MPPRFPILCVALALSALCIACDDGESGVTDDLTTATANDGGIDTTAQDGQTDAADMPGEDTGISLPPDADRDMTALPPGSSLDEVIAEFGTLDTIAGRGTIQDKAVNGWVASMEGGDATDAELSRPHAALADDAGRIFIADKDAHAIRVVETDGTIHTVAGTNVAGDGGDGPTPATSAPLNQPNGIWVRGDGTLYILDLGNDKVRRVTPDGELTTLFTIGGAGAGRGLWVADDESVAYVAAGSVLKRWTPSTGVETIASGFVSLGNLAVDDEGRLWVTDRLGHRVDIVNPDSGARTPVAGNGTPSGGGDGQPALQTGFEEVRGVWPHPAGGFFLVTHKGGGHVWYVDPAGTAHVFVYGDTDDSHGGDGAWFRAPGTKISEPRAVALTPTGEMLVTENDYGFVRRISRSAP